MPTGSRSWDGTVGSGRTSEYWADAVVHGVALLAVLAGCVGLATGVRAEAATVAATLAYAIGLVATFGCSAIYNLSPPGRWKARLQRLDHAAIFLMIAGTYTPVAGIGIGGWTGAALVVVVWLGAAAGMAMKLLAFGRLERLSTVAYLLLGWVGVVALPDLLRTLPGDALALLGAGGLLYSLGVIAHVSPRLRYGTAIWHGFVLAAAVCHYLLVLRLVAA